MRGVKFTLLGLVTIVASCATPSGAASPAPGIVGMWHQVEADCGNTEPVGELIFEANGHYSVTWLPFETYKDYWGGWRYDAHSRVLTLTMDGGNYQPADRVLSGEVIAAAHQLTLGSLSLGSPQQGVRCTAPFRR